MVELCNPKTIRDLIDYDTFALHGNCCEQPKFVRVYYQHQRFIPHFLLTQLDCLRKIIRKILTKSSSTPRIETKHEQTCTKKLLLSNFGNINFHITRPNAGSRCLCQLNGNNDWVVKSLDCYLNKHVSKWRDSRMSVQAILIWWRVLRGECFAWHLYASFPCKLWRMICWCTSSMGRLVFFGN